jgi:hypothetical protein
MTFSTVYEEKPISRDPGKSREIIHYFPLSREINFPGEWESLAAAMENRFTLFCFLNCALDFSEVFVVDHE